MKRALFIAPFLAVLGMLVACSDADTEAADAGVQDIAPVEASIGNDPDPEKIVGGGTSGGTIAGRLNVYVLDDDTDEPLQGVFVMIDDGAEHQGTTDEEGLITFRTPGLTGPVTLTAGKPGYTTGSVVGLDAANVTLGLGTRAATPPPVTGNCSGQVKDWDQLPPPLANHYHVGYATFLMDEDLESPANEVEQPPGNLNLYAPGPPWNKDNWMLKVPAGDFGVAMLVLDVDTKGTTAQDDDETTLTHLGAVTGLKVGQGQLLAGVEMAVSPVDETLTVKLPAKPAGTSVLQASVLVQLKSGELVPVSFGTTDQTSFAAPALDGDFSGGNYWLIFSATRGADESDEERQPMSLLIKRKITDVSKTVEGTLLELPTDLKLNGKTLSFTAPDHSSFSTLELMPESSGASYWSISFISSASSFTLPTLPAEAEIEPLPSGKLFLSASSMEVLDVDLNNARFSELTDKVERISRQGVAVDYTE